MEKLLIENQFAELSKKYSGLHLSETTDEDYLFIIKGSLLFEVIDEKYPIADTFDLEIKISKYHPLVLPKVSETTNRIPRINNYHINSDGTFCLASRRKEHELFCKLPSLLGFTENLVIPFLYSFSCYAKYSIRPYGELSHGSQGLLEDYKKLLGFSSKKEVYDFLIYLQSMYKNPKKRAGIRTRERCPCGSKLRFNRCHKRYDEMINYYPEFYLSKDIEDIKNNSV